MRKSVLTFFVFLFALGVVPNAYTQMISGNAKQEESAKKQTPQQNKAVADSPSDIATDELNMTDEEKEEVMERLKKLNPRIKNGNLVLNPIDLGQTQDGSERGTAGFVQISGKEEENAGNIFLYYSNFKIIRSAANGVRCQVRFNVLNGLNSKLSNLSVKLVWPGINTNVSFSNVNPNFENYFDYMLLGEGCYSMDKLPNIIVNRCRVRGMNQEECAGKIRWLAKNN